MLLLTSVYCFQFYYLSMQKKYQVSRIMQFECALHRVVVRMHRNYVNKLDKLVNEKKSGGIGFIYGCLCVCVCVLNWIPLHREKSKDWRTRMVRRQRSKNKKKRERESETQNNGRRIKSNLFLYGFACQFMHIAVYETAGQVWSLEVWMRAHSVWPNYLCVSVCAPKSESMQNKINKQ